MTKFQTLPKILGRESCSVERMDGICCKGKLFKVFCSIFRLEGAILRDKSSMCMFQEPIGNITPQILGRLGNFPVFALFSTCPLKSGIPTPIKVIF